MILSIVLTAFVLVAPVELPDKTMFATLVLASRFRALPVLTGVRAAFVVQTAIAVAAGSLLSYGASGWRSASPCFSQSAQLCCGAAQ